LDINSILSPEDIVKGDDCIISMMASFRDCPVETIGKQSDNNPDPFCFFKTNIAEDSDFMAFQNYKMEHYPEIVDLLSFWNKKLNTPQDHLAKVALEILSSLITSSAAEREFSQARRSLGFQRFRLSKDHVEDINIIMGNPRISSDFII